MGPFASSVLFCDFIFGLSYASVVSYARLWQKHAFHFSFIYHGEHTDGTYHVT